MRTVRGDTLDYDALLVAVGATPDMAIPGALTFSGPRDVGAFAALLADLDAGRVQRVAFAVPATVTWALPLYELALMTGEHVRTRGLEGVGLVLVTPEHSPLEAFGPASRRTSGACWPSAASRSAPTRWRCGPGRAGSIVAHGEPVQAERIVSLPRLVGPWIGGLPHDGEGFLTTDEHGAVLGTEAVWAAGDGTAFPLKQGGLAAQQAGAAAAAIARSLGADVRPEPFRPVLRGMLLDPAGPRFLDSTRGDVPTTPLWWPPAKVAAPHLSELSRAARARRGVDADRRTSTSASCCSAWPSATRRRRGCAGAALPERGSPGPAAPAARRGRAPRRAGGAHAAGDSPPAPSSPPHALWRSPTMAARGHEQNRTMTSEALQQRARPVIAVAATRSWSISSSLAARRRRSAVAPTADLMHVRPPTPHPHITMQPEAIR